MSGVRKMVMEVSLQQIRQFRLHNHHLAERQDEGHIMAVVGACGMQNTPPGAWETALFNRISHCQQADMNTLLYQDKSLVQAWSFRGAPVVFPIAEGDVFLSALVPKGNEPWIYTRGISGALDFLQMPFDVLLEIMQQAILGLNTQTVERKCVLDQTIAEWMRPLLPKEKWALWNSPSMYGASELQTVGGAVVSFLLRPCAFLGLVVFGERIGTSPTFTSYQRWLGQGLHFENDAVVKLLRKFLHCYGPTTSEALANWLGCSGKQARRMWQTVLEEIEPVKLFDGSNAFVLSVDKPLLMQPPTPQREWILLGGHDPYLDQRDRHVLLKSKAHQKQVWQMVSNPGVVLYHGEIIGIWQGKKKDKGLEVKMTLWSDLAAINPQALQCLAEEYAAFRGLNLLKLSL